MDAGKILESLVRGALDARGHRGRRHRGAARSLTGGRGRKGGVLNAGTLLTLAGVAWGAMEAAGRKGQGAASTGAAPPPSPSGAVPPPPLPPIPGSAAAAGLPPELLRAIRLTISAARADGELSPEEREAILAQARQAGVEDVARDEIEHPRPLAEILAGADPKTATELYTLAFTIVRADEEVTGGERIYLAQLAHRLGLDAGEAARLEREAAAGIDREAAGET